MIVPAFGVEFTHSFKIGKKAYPAAVVEQIWKQHELAAKIDRDYDNNNNNLYRVEIKNPAKPHKPWTRRTFRRGTGPGELLSISECILDGEVLASHTIVNIPV